VQPRVGGELVELPRLDGTRAGKRCRSVRQDDAGSEAEDAAASCGGESFTAATRVLLASGAAIPISQLKPGEKVLAADTKTGRTQAEAVTAVLVHHDADLYDLKIRDHRTTSVIDTTSNHLFFVPGAGGQAGRWVKAAALRNGTHLRTPDGTGAVVAAGWAPVQRDGWMWDLTVPGGNDHDFYIDTEAASVLVHNCPMYQRPNAIARATGYTTRQIRSAIEQLKQGSSWRGLGSRTNPDVFVDTDTGEAYPELPEGEPAEDSIGNIFDYLPDSDG